MGNPPYYVAYVAVRKATTEYTEVKHIWQKFVLSECFLIRQWTETKTMLSKSVVALMQK